MTASEIEQQRRYLESNPNRLVQRLLATLDARAAAPSPASALKRDDEGHALSPNFDRIDDLRHKLSGWHFSKESLTKSEREILYVAEQVMGTLDALCGGYVR